MVHLVCLSMLFQGIVDVAGQEHGLSVFEIDREAMTGSTSVLHFCDPCEVSHTYLISH